MRWGRDPVVRVVVLCVAAGALLATSGPRTSIEASVDLPVEVPAGGTASVLVTVAGTAAAATQAEPVVPWDLSASLRTETTTPGPLIVARRASGDVPLRRGEGHPDACPPGEACVRRYRVVVRAPADHPLRDDLWLRAEVNYDGVVRHEGRTVDLRGDTPPDEANLALAVDDGARTVVADTDGVDSYVEHPADARPAVLVTREQPVVRAVVRQAYVREGIPDLPPGADRASGYGSVEMQVLAGDADTTATALWRRADGSRVASFGPGGEGWQEHKAELRCEGARCALELDLVVRLDQGEWALFTASDLVVRPAPRPTSASEPDARYPAAGPPEFEVVP